MIMADEDDRGLSEMYFDTATQDASAELSKQRRALDLALIDLVEQFPVLYNPHDRDYKDNIHRQKIWEQISRNIKELGFTDVSTLTTEKYLRKRFTYLRKRFAEEKQAQEAPPGSDVRIRTTFPLYERMSFLKSIGDSNSNQIYAIGGANSSDAIDESIMSVVRIKSEFTEPSVGIDIPGTANPAKPMTMEVPRKASRNELTKPSRPESYRGVKRALQDVSGELKELKKSCLSAPSDPRWSKVANIIGTMTRDLDDNACGEFSRKMLGHACNLLAKSFLDEDSEDSEISPLKKVKKLQNGNFL